MKKTIIIIIITILLIGGGIAIYYKQFNTEKRTPNGVFVNMNLTYHSELCPLTKIGGLNVKPKGCLH